MPDSLFGRPSQHLLPSHRPPNVEDNNRVGSDPHTATPVPLVPQFSGLSFNSIGKVPQLLSRISQSQPDHADYHSPTPSPTPTPTLPFTTVIQSNPSSRPTLLQQLAGNDFDNSSMAGASGWQASTGQSNVPLASRIQMSTSPPIDTMSSGFPRPKLRLKRVIEDTSLIPPVEVLLPPSESLPDSPTSLAPPPETAHVMSSVPLSMDTTTTRVSRLPTPTISTNTAFKPAVPIPSITVADVTMRDPGSSSSATAATDSVARQERLQSVGANLARFASPLPPSTLSLSPGIQGNDDIALNQPIRSQNASPLIIPRNFGETGSSTGDFPADASALSLATSPSLTNLIHEYGAQRRIIVGAFQEVNTVLDTIHRIQADSESALALRMRSFEDQRVAFEHMKRAEEITLQQQLRELQKKREDLNAREASLASLERESKAREEARKAMFAKRQAQEEERRAAEAKRFQEQIAAAVKELEEHEAWRARGLLGQLSSEPLPDDLPTEPVEGMDKGEEAVIKSRTELLRAIKHLRRMHTDKVEKLHESNRTLRRMEEERKQRESEEAERRQIADEERTQAQAKMEHILQAQSDLRQLEAERKRQEEKQSREQVRVLAQQRSHIDAEAQGSSRTEKTNAQTFQNPARLEETSQRQAIADIRTARDATFSTAALNAMSVDEDRRVSTPHHPVPLPIIRISPGGPPSTTTSPSKQKEDVPPTGSVTLANPIPEATGEHLQPKPTRISLSLPPSRHISPATPPFIPISNGNKPSFLSQFASERNSLINSGIPSTPAPDPKPAIPRTPKSQTVLDPTNRGNQEVNIGPVPGVSPTQRNVNLRHLKRSRGRIEENDSGDRSVRMATVKTEDHSLPSVKDEEHDGHARELMWASLPTHLPASLPSRPAVIPPPRPRTSKKRLPALASQTDPSSSYPREYNDSLARKGEAEGITSQQSREYPFQGPLSSQVINAPDQLPTPSQGANSLLLAPVRPETQPAGYGPLRDRAENRDATSSEPASATLPHTLDWEDPYRTNRRPTGEHRKAHNGHNSRVVWDHYSPAHTTSRSSHRPVDTWYPPNSSNGSRAEPISPTTGKKRPSDFSDNEYSHRARRLRDDVWIAEDHDPVDTYRPNRDRRPDTDAEERRASYRTQPSLPDDIRPVSYDNKTWNPPSSEDPSTQSVRLENSYRRPENDDVSQRYQPSDSGYNTVVDQHHTDDVRVGQTYEPTEEEWMDIEHNSSLLARMSDTQRHPHSNNPRGRGGRGDSGRGRSRGAVRNGPALMDRITGPLGERVT